MKQNRISWRVRKAFNTIALVLIVASLFSTSAFAIVWSTESTRITQQYSSSHDSIDIGPITPGVAGDDVYSFAGGTLYTYAYNSSAGYTAHINHPTVSSSQYIYTRSSHMTDPSTLSSITTSGSVSSGTKIGEMNTTGTDSTGVHLHYHMRYNSVAYSATSGWYAGTSFDPKAYFESNLSSRSRLAPTVDSSLSSRKVSRNVSKHGLYFQYDPLAVD